MPRRAGLYIAGIPDHVVQRVNNREIYFKVGNYQARLILLLAGGGSMFECRATFRDLPGQ